MSVKVWVIIQNDVIVDEGIVYHNKVSFKKFYGMLYYLDEISNVIFEAIGVYSRPLERFFIDFEINYNDPIFMAHAKFCDSYEQLKTLFNNYLQIIEDIKIISNRIRRGLEL